jgi:hypothetical protein
LDVEILRAQCQRFPPGTSLFCSSQHPLQLLDPLQDLLLDRPQFNQELQRRTVLHLVVHQFLGAVEAEVAALGSAASLQGRDNMTCNPNQSRHGRGSRPRS